MIGGLEGASRSGHPGLEVVTGAAFDVPIFTADDQGGKED